MSQPKPNPECEGGFHHLVPESVIDLFADPPPEWKVGEAAPAPAPAPAPSPQHRARRAKSLARYPWTDAKPYRVHYYDPKKTGTWMSYFDDLEAARAFAMGKPLWGEGAIVETKPGYSAQKRAGGGRP